MRLLTADSESVGFSWDPTDLRAIFGVIAFRGLAKPAKRVPTPSLALNNGPRSAEFAD